MLPDSMLSIYFVTILFIIAGGGLGYLMFRRIAAIFVFNFGFGLLAFLVLPGFFEIMGLL